MGDMHDHFIVQMSNRTEILYEGFRRRLFEASLPFTRRVVIVPSAAMKSWLMLRMGRDPDLGIAAGIELSYVEPGMRKLSEMLCAGRSEGGYEAGETELALALESEICEVVAELPYLLADDLSLWGPMLAYLGIFEPIKRGGKISRRSEKRAGALAAVLAKHFIDYGLYGGAMLPRFLKEGGWQSLLWQRMEVVFQRWDYPYRKFEGCELSGRFSSNDLQVHIFGLSYIAPLYHRFLLKISERVPVSYYLLSPCQKFWSDQLSDRERWRVGKFWEGRGVSDGERWQLDTYLRDTNPLLANFGRLGREMACQLDEGDPLVEARYVIPQQAASQGHYDGLLTPEIEFEGSEGPWTLLQALQTDIALLRNPDEGEKMRFKGHDATIQIHAAPKPVREVEVIHDLILSVIDRHKNDAEPITPGDIVVMASNLAIYEPYIRALFEGEGSLVDIQLMDVHMPAQNPFIQSFLQLIRLPLGRWDNTSLMRLFESRAFKQRHRLAEEDIAKIEKWMKEAHIFWGGDAGHREEIFERDHCQRKPIGGSGEGTWEQGIGRLLEGLVAALDRHPQHEGKAFASSFEIDPSQAELLGELLKILRSLLADLRPLADGTAMTLGHWGGYLRCLCEGYLSAVGDDEAADGRRILFDHIDKLAKAETKLKGRKFPFHSIRRHLEEGLRAQSSHYRESNLQAVRFCSLLPMRAVPAKVVILMGMGDGIFPRQEESASINLLTSYAEADYCPSQVDFDRYLFLEALLSARRYFMMSYTSYQPGESQELLPSLLVTELIAYMDKAYASAAAGVGDVISMGQRCVYKHPFKSYHSDYFTPESRFKSYSPVQFRAALSYYSPAKMPPHQFLSTFELSEEALDESPDILPLSDLAAFAKNPLKFYFNQFLDVYIESEEDRQVKEEEDLLISPIHLSRWTKAGIHLPAQQVVAQAKSSGQFPAGPFGSAEERRLGEGIHSLKNSLAALGINPEMIFTLDFNERHDVAKQTPEGWQLPPLSIDVQGIGPVKLIGQIEGVTEKGWIIHDKNGIEEAAKIWPGWLVYSCLVERDALPFSMDVIFTKGSKPIIRKADWGDGSQLLADYIYYYYQGLRSPSPLMPKCVELFLKDSVEKVRDELQLEAENEAFSPSYNAYLKWLRRSSRKDYHDSQLNSWGSIAKKLLPLI